VIIALGIRKISRFTSERFNTECVDIPFSL